MSETKKVISDEAVEAAAKAVPAGASIDKDDLRELLEAAAPHMLAEAWDDAFDKGSERGAWEAAPVTTEPHFTNPYRSQA